jgi:hypothetical protein
MTYFWPGFIGNVTLRVVVNVTVDGIISVPAHHSFGDNV